MGGASGTGGGAAAGDAIPTSAVSFFQGPSCPTGWSPYMPANGRSIVPTVATSPGGVTAGAPLNPGEDRTHTHGVTSTFTIGSVEYAGIAGASNTGVGVAGAVTMMTTSDPASTGLPYVQLLVCRKDAAPVPRATPLPPGMQMFFDMSGCPVGWLQTANTQGRFLVGLPAGAPQDVTFGGPALSGLDGGVAPALHAHGNTATLTTTSHGIALAAGCCADGYAANGTVTATMDTAPADTGLPFIQLLSCQKQ